MSDRRRPGSPACRSRAGRPGRDRETRPGAAQRGRKSELPARHQKPRRLLHGAARIGGGRDGQVRDHQLGRAIRRAGSTPGDPGARPERPGVGRSLGLDPRARLGDEGRRGVERRQAAVEIEPPRQLQREGARRAADLHHPRARADLDGAARAAPRTAPRRRGESRCRRAWRAGPPSRPASRGSFLGSGLASRRRGGVHPRTGPSGRRPPGTGRRHSGPRADRAPTRSD